MTANNLTKWIKKSEELRLSDSCIKGIAFFLGLKCHESKTQDEVDEKIKFFIDKEDCFALLNSIDSVKAALAYYSIIKIFNSFSGALEFKFPENRLDSNGQITNAFTPSAKGEKFHDVKSIQEAKLKDYHEAYESFFEELGYVFSLNGITAEQAFAFSDTFVISANFDDVKGFGFFIEVFKIATPPVFISLLNLSAVRNLLSEDDLLPFQTAQNGYLGGQDVDLCNFVWNNQRILFYNQKTLEKINLDYQWVTIVDFINFLNAYFLNYWSHDNIKEFFRKNLTVLGRYDIPLSDFNVNTRADFFPLILRMVNENDGYSLNEKLSPSNALQYKACFYFRFIFAIAANPNLLSMP